MVSTAGTDVVERRVVRQLAPATVVRVAFAIGLALVAIVMVGLVALYLLAMASGAMRSVDAFITSLGLDFNLAALLPIVLILGVMGTVTTTALAGVLSVLYNLVAELLGGVEVVTRERRRQSRTRP